MGERLFGEIQGYPEGTIFDSREALSKAGLHRPTMAGISGTAEDGADSIVLSGTVTSIHRVKTPQELNQQHSHSQKWKQSQSSRERRTNEPDNASEHPEQGARKVPEAGSARQKHQAGERSGSTEE